MWRTVELGDVLSLQNGYAFKSSEYEDDGYFVMRITNVQQGYISNHNPKYIKIDSSSKLAKFILNEGDILVSLTGDVGRVGVIKDEHLPAALNQRVARVTEVNPALVNVEFLFHYMNSDTFRTQVEKFAHGAAQANVSTKDILSISLALPPLAEQQRIVGKLDATFAEIDRAIELASQQLSLFDDLAYRLTEDLTHSENHQMSKLCDVTEIQPPKKLSRDKLSDSDDVTFMGMDRLGIEQKYSSSDEVKSLSDAYKSYQYFEENDVLLAKITPCFENGKLGIANKLVNGVGFGSSEFVVIRTGSELTPEYAYYSLLCRQFRREGEKNMSGAVGHKRVTKEYIANYALSIPTVDEQIEITNRLDEVWQHRDIGRKSLSDKIIALAALKSSILAQALQPSEAA